MNLTKNILTLLLTLGYLTTAYSQQGIDEGAIGSTILLENQNSVFGSGVVLADSQYIYLVTARHVIFKNPHSNELQSDTVQITSYGRNISNRTENRFSVYIKGIRQLGLLADDPLNDVAVVLVAVVKDNLAKYLPFIRKTGNKVLSQYAMQGTKDFNSVKMGQDAYIFGYPNTIGLNMGQFEMNKPLAIKGLIAGKNELTNRIILNAQVYHGNSGGPVYANFGIAEGVLFIGIVTELIPYVSEGLTRDSVQFPYRYDSLHAVYNNSNFSVVVPIDYALQLIKRMELSNGAKFFYNTLSK